MLLINKHKFKQKCNDTRYAPTLLIILPIPVNFFFLIIFLNLFVLKQILLQFLWYGRHINFVNF